MTTGCHWRLVAFWLNSQACGIREIENIEGSSFTRHCFNDPYGFVDVTMHLCCSANVRCSLDVLFPL